MTWFQLLTENGTESGLAEQDLSVKDAGKNGPHLRSGFAISAFDGDRKATTGPHRRRITPVLAAQHLLYRHRVAVQQGLSSVAVACR